MPRCQNGAGPSRASITVSHHMFGRRQDHNGLSHQDPGWSDVVMNKRPEIVPVYLLPEANTLLSTYDHCPPVEALLRRGGRGQAAPMDTASARRAGRTAICRCGETSPYQTVAVGGGCAGQSYTAVCPMWHTRRWAVITMMSATDEPVIVLSASQSWELLASVALGRLITSVEGQPAIFPVNFVVQRRTVLFRTAEGTKLVSTAIKNNVLFEADGYDRDEGWSVIVKGNPRRLRTEDEIAEAQQAGLRPWTATLKLHWVRIVPYSITGRRIRFGPEPDD